MKLFKSGGANPEGYNVLLLAGMLLAVLSLLITFCYPAIEVTDDHTADSINQQYLDFTGSKPTSESVWVLSGIFSAFGSDANGNSYTGWGTTPDGWLYGARIVNYTPSQYSNDTNGYSVSWSDDERGGHFTYNNDSTVNNKHSAGDLYGAVVLDVGKKSDIFFSSSGKVESGDNFYYQFSGGAWRYAFQPVKEYVTVSSDGNNEHITVVPNTSSLSLIWYDYYAGSNVGGSGLAGQLIISYEDKGVAYLTGAMIVSAFDSDISTSKFTMSFNGVDMNVYIRIDPSKLAQGLTVEECYNLGYWSVMVSSTSVNADSMLASDYEFNPFTVFQTMIDLLTFNTADYGLTGMSMALASIMIVIPLAVGVLVLGLNNYVVLILAGLYGVISAWNWGLFGM